MQSVPSSKTMALSADVLLRLLQLASPSLPVGAYSYSEGLESLVHDGAITNAATLTKWLQQELRYGAIRLEAAAMIQAYRAMTEDDCEAIASWNHWLSATRDTEEIREQNWQMGQTLVRLLKNLEPDLTPTLDSLGLPCNVAIAFSLASAYWQIDMDAATLSYTHSWITNLVNAGIKLIPLGQTEGQMLLLKLYPDIQNMLQEIKDLSSPQLQVCNWGIALASMNHESMYSRLFRS